MHAGGRPCWKLRQGCKNEESRRETEAHDTWSATAYRAPLPSAKKEVRHLLRHNLQMIALEQRRVGAVLACQRLVVGKEALVELLRNLLRRDARINGDVQRMPALPALVDQPDVQLVLVGIDPEPPGIDKNTSPL